MFREIIESVFKIAAINNNKKILLPPLGSRDFKNDPVIFASLFVDTIIKKDIIIFYRNNYGNL